MKIEVELTPEQEAAVLTDAKVMERVETGIQALFEQEIYRLKDELSKEFLKNKTIDKLKALAKHV